jgi:diaminohydroxyphosphoribosylaminopyrimidine deaminase/5-amino-6-(5-phosphoribosylamino)uracil reductase
MLDPNPSTSGKGVATLQQAGIAVSVLSHSSHAIRASNGQPNTGLADRITSLTDQANDLNCGFFKRMRIGLPWIRLKVASSLDGYAALPNGQSQWLTGALARTDTHHWRGSSCAVLTGIGTLLADDAQLTVRHVNTPRQPLRIVLDTQLRTPLSARLLQTAAHAPVLIIHGCSDTAKQAALIQAGAELLQLPLNTHATHSTHSGSLDLFSVFSALGKRGLNEIHCEAGSLLNGALLESGMVDEVMLYQAPLLLGAGLPWAKNSLSTNTHTHLDQVPRWKLHSTTQLGDDVRLVLRP